MRILIAVPCMDTVPALFMRSLLTMRLQGEVEISLAIGSLIYDARNRLAQKAVSENFDRVLWLDSDMIFGPDLMEKLNARIDEGAELVSGLYFTRRAPLEPVVYSDIRKENGVPKRDPYMDYPRDAIFEVAGCGFGGVMMTADLLRRVGDEFGLPFSPILGFGEDLSFCLRVGKLGIPMFCDSAIKLTHLGWKEYNEELFLEGSK